MNCIYFININQFNNQKTCLCKAKPVFDIASNDEVWNIKICLPIRCMLLFIIRIHLPKKYNIKTHTQQNWELETENVFG